MLYTFFERLLIMEATSSVSSDLAPDSNDAQVQEPVANVETELEKVNKKIESGNENRKLDILF